MKNIKKISIIGVGFMGGSLALALREKFPSASIWGYARSKKSYNKLKSLKLLSKVSLELKQLIEDSDIVILSLPVKSIIKYFNKIGPFLKKGAIVIDLGSSKKEIEVQAKKILPKSVNFVGCHPLCGSQKSGAEFSQTELYKGANCFITSSPAKKSTVIVKKIWQAIGSNVLLIKPDLHDKVVSSVSHLPHIISFSLTQFVPEKYLKFSPTSLKDITRISNSPPQVWTDIFLSNSKNILKDLNKFIKTLKEYEALLEKGDETKISNLISKVNAKQKKII